MTDQLQNDRDLLVQNPNDAEALARVESALVENADWTGLVRLTQDRSDSLGNDDAKAEWRRLATVLEAHAEGAKEDSKGAVLYLEVGRILEERLERPDEALSFYRKSYRKDPTRTDALYAARSVYEMRGEWQLVIQTCAIEARTTKDKNEQGVLYTAMAEICEGPLDEAGAAYRWACKALSVAPGLEEAGAALNRLKEVGGAAQERFESVLADSKSLRDRRQRSATLLEKASSWFDEAPNEPWVEELILHVLGQDPRNANAMHLLEEYYEANERWLELSRYLFLRIKRTPRKTDREALYRRLADIAELNLADKEQSVHWHREVLKIDPVARDSLQPCVDYFSLNGDWPELVKIYEMALRTRNRGPDEQAMLVQIAMILWRKLNDAKGAETYFRRIKLSDPKNALMLQFYSDYYESKSDWRRLLGVLASRRDAAESDETKIELGIEMASVAEERLKNREKAIDLWKELLKLDDELEPAREALRRLYKAASKWNAYLDLLKDDLADLSSHQTDEKLAISFEMVRIYRDHLRLPVMVVSTYHEILQLEPGNAEALDALEKKYRQGGRWSELIQILEQRADVHSSDSDDATFRGLCNEIADLWLQKFSNHVEACKALERIFEIAPEDGEVIDRLIGIYRQRKDWKGLFEAYQRKLEISEEVERNALLEEMAELASARLDASEEAMGLWQQILGSEPTHEGAYDALDKLYQQHEKWEALAELLFSRIELNEGEAEQIGALRRLGELFHKQLNDSERAIEAWRSILELAPDDTGAEAHLRESFLQAGDWQNLERLYGSRNRWDALVAVLRNAAERADDVSVQCDLYGRVAKVCVGPLENESAAVEYWERMLGCDADNEAAARSLAPHYRGTENWTGLIEVLAVLARVEQEHRVTPQLEMAEIFEKHLDEPGNALSCYADVLQDESGGIRFLPKMLELAQKAGAEALLADELEARLESGLDGPEDDAQNRRMLGGLYKDSLDQPDRSAQHFEALIDADMAENADLDALRELYERLARWDELLVIYEELLARASSESKKIELLAAVGRIQAEILEDLDAAQEAYRQIAELDPTNIKAIRGLQLLAEREENWSALEEYLEAELERSEAPADRAELYVRLAKLAQRLDDSATAFERYVDALVENTENTAVIDALEGFLDGNFAAEAAKALEVSMRDLDIPVRFERVLSILAGTADDAIARARYLEELGRLRQDRLDDDAGAHQSFGDLLALEPAREDIRDEYEMLTAALDAWGDAVDLYGRLGVDGMAAPEDEALAAQYSRWQANLLDTRLDDLNEARSVYLRIADVTGDSADTLAQLEGLAVRLEDWNFLAEVLERKLHLEEGETERTEILMRMAELFESSLDAPEEALSVYRRILEEAPDNDRAQQESDRLLRQAGAYGQLVTALEGRRTRAESDAKASLSVAIADVYRTQLDDLEAAIENYGLALAADQSHQPAFDALEDCLMECADEDADAALRGQICTLLEPVAAARDDWQLKLQILQMRIGDASEPDARLPLRLDLSKVYEEEAGDSGAALATVATAFVEDGGDRVVFEELLRLTDKLGSWGELSETIHAVFADPVAGARFEDNERIELLQMASDAFETKAARIQEAIDMNLLILEALPSNELALASLDRFYDTTGHLSSRAEILERRVEGASEPAQRIELGIQLAELYEQKLAEPQKAADVYSDLRDELEDDDVRAHEALERIYTGLRNHDALAEILLDHAQRVTDLVAKKDVTVRAARVLEEELERADDATLVLAEFLEVKPDDSEVLRHLEALYRQSDQHLELLENLDQQLALDQSAERVIELNVQKGLLLADELGEPEAAVVCFGEVVRDDPENEGALMALEHLCDEPMSREAASEILIPIYRESGEWEPLSKLMRSLLEELTDPAERVSALRDIAAIERDQLGISENAFDALCEAYRLQPSTEGLEQEVEVLAARLGRYEILAELYGEALQENPDRAQTLYLKIAQVAELQLDDIERAIEAYSEILELDVENQGAFEALESLYERNEQPESMVELLMRKAGLEEDGIRAKGVLMRAAAVQEERLEDIDGAIDSWRAILARLEDDPDAMSQLGRLLESVERWDELVAHYEYQAERCEDDMLRGEIDYELGALCQEKLGDGERAVELYGQVLGRDPEHGAAREALETLFADESAAAAIGVHQEPLIAVLEPLYREEENKEGLVRLLEARKQLGEGSDNVLDVLIELAELRQELEPSTGYTFEAWAEVFRAKPEQSLLTTLRASAEAANALQEYAELLEQVSSEIDETLLQLEVLIELGDVLLAVGGRDEQAKEVLREALLLSPANEPARDALVKVMTDAQSWDELVELYLELGEGGGDAQPDKSALLKASQLLEDVIGDSERAVDVYSRLVEIDPDDHDVLAGYEALLERAERWVEFAEHLRSRLEAEEAPDLRADLGYRIGRIALEHLGDGQDAIAVWQDVLLEDAPGHSGVIDALEDLVMDFENESSGDIRREAALLLASHYSAEAQWSDVVLMLRVQLESMDEPWEKIDILTRIAALEEGELEAPASALETLGQAFVLDFDNSELRDEIERLAQVTSAWQVLFNIYDSGIDDFGDIDGAIEIYCRMAEIQTEGLANPQGALECFQRALQLDDSRLEMLGKLESLQESLGEFESLVGTLGRKAELVETADDRHALWEKAANILVGELGRREEAIEFYRYIVEEAPENLEILERLTGLYSETEQWEDWVDALREQIELIEQPERLRALYVEISEGYDGPLANPDESINALRAAMEHAPGDSALRMALEQRLTAGERWSEVVELLDGALEEISEEDLTERARLELEIARIMETHLSMKGEAIDRYGELLLAQPDCTDAVNALEALLSGDDGSEGAARILEGHYQRSENWDALARVQAKEADSTVDDFSRQNMLIELASLHESQRDNPSEAFEVWVQALNTADPTPEIFTNLDRLAPTLDKETRLSQVYEAFVEAHPEGEHRPGVLRRLARLYEGSSALREKAIETWLQVSDIEPYDSEALESLDVLLTTEGQWEGLCPILERRLDLLDGQALSDLRVRLGRLREVVFEDVAGAVELHGSILADDPQHRAARIELERIAMYLDYRNSAIEVLEPVYKDEEAWQSLAILKEIGVETCADDQGRAALYLEAAAIREEKLSDTGQAMENAFLALQVIPSHPEAREMSIRLAAENDAWGELVGAFEGCIESGESDEQLLEDHLNVAEWCAMDLEEPARAARHYEAALALEPSNQLALGALEQIYEEGQNHRALLDVLRRRVDESYDLDEKRACLMRMGQLMSGELDDVSGACGVFEECIDLDESDAEAMAALETLLRNAENWERLSALLERRISVLEDADELVATLEKLAALHMRTDADGGLRAQEAYERILDVDGEHDGALEALIELYEKGEKWSEYQGVLQRKLENQNDETAQLELLLSLGEVTETKLSDIPGAIEFYSRAMDIEPVARRAIAPLRRLYRKEEHWFELVELVRSHLLDIREQADNGRTIDLLLELGEVSAQHLGDLDGAQEALTEILELEPDNPRALSISAFLHEQSGEWEAAAEALQRSLEHVSGDERASLWRRLGLIYLEELDQADRAVEALERAVGENSDPQALTALIGIARSRGEDVRLLGLLNISLPTLEPKEQVSAYKEIGNLCMNAGQEPEAREAFEKAHELGDVDLEVLGYLVDSNVKEVNYAAADELIDAAITELEAARRFKDMYRIVFRKGVLLEERGMEDDAITAYRRCFDHDATDVPNLLRLGALYAKRGDDSDALRVLQAALLHQTQVEKTDRVGLFYRLGSVRASMGESRKARDMYQRALSIDPEHKPSLAALEDLG